MNARIARILLIVLLAVSVSGCSTVLTRMGPVVSRLEDGEKSMGEFAEYKFSGGITSNVIYLEKTPMCAEIAEKLRVAQKDIRGRGFAIVEIVFFGLGFVDMARARAASEESRTVTPLAKHETGKVLVCGEKQPAGDELLVFEDRQRTFQRKARTKADGTLDLDKLFNDVDRPLNLKIRRDADETVYVSFLYVPKEK